MNKPVYHIVVQGVHNAGAFAGDTNKEAYWERVIRYKLQLGIHVYAFAIFDNHAHFLMRGTEQELSGLMRRVGVSYSHWYRRQYNHEGSIFRGRPNMERLENDGQILKAARYIHQEPVRTGLVSSMESYPWSSYWMYQSEDSVIDRDEITERLRFWGRFEDYMTIPEPAMFLEEKQAHFGFTDMEVEAMIDRRLHQHPRVELELMPHPIRNYLLAVLRFVDQISILQLARVSGVGRGIVQRITREDLKLTLFQGPRILHLSGEDLPLEVIEHIHDWYVLSGPQKLIQPSDIQVPMDHLWKTWCRPAHAFLSDEQIITLRGYQEQSLLRFHPQTLMYVERRLEDGSIRKGLVGCLDLEQVSLSQEIHAPVRFLNEPDMLVAAHTMAIRENHAPEATGIVLAVDDPFYGLIEPLETEKGDMHQVYEIPIPGQKGQISGYVLPKRLQDKVLERLDVMADPGFFANRLKTNAPPYVFFTVQGTEELAGAVLAYEQAKARDGVEVARSSPIRYHMVEIINVHEESVRLSPAFPVCEMDLKALSAILNDLYPGTHPGKPRLHELEIRFVIGAESGSFSIPYKRRRGVAAPYPLSILLPALNTYTALYDTEVSYHYGLEEALATAKEQGKAVFYWNAPTKEETLQRLMAGIRLPVDALALGDQKDRRCRIECRMLQ